MFIAVLFLEIATATLTFINHHFGYVSSHQHRSKTLHQQKAYNSLKAQMMVIIF